MNIAITFRQLEASEAVKQYASEKVAKLQKFLRKPLSSASRHPAGVRSSIEPAINRFASPSVQAGSDSSDVARTSQGHSLTSFSINNSGGRPA